MRTTLDRVLSTLIGDHRRYPLERRLFNTISLLNGAINCIGAFALARSQSHTFLVLLQLGTGLMLLVFYYLSRFREIYSFLYWPFVGVILVFLLINSVFNAGSYGGAHYYLIPALVIAIIVSSNSKRTVAAFFLFAASTASLFVLEGERPELFVHYLNPAQRLLDVAGNFVFVQILSGVLVVVLTKSLNQERAKSELLLLNILPVAVAEELKSMERVAPRHYESASVLFTDFAGFTQIAEKMTPQELIEELDSCFSQFDELIKKHNLEKIKTIGDSYMAVGGVPAPNNTHAVDCVLAALEIQSFMSELADRKKAQDKPCWQLRLGIHTGPLVAGVIGKQKFAYDVWGDTVNTASRLESSGAVGRVNISAATYEQVKGFFLCERRGRVSAKNKGEIEMYFVNGMQPGLAESSRPSMPNRKFLES